MVSSAWVRIVLHVSLAAVIVGGLVVVPRAEAVQASSTIAGAWAGAINLPPGPLAIGVSFAADAAGAWSGTIDIPAQGAKGLPLGNIVIKGREVQFAMTGVPGDPRFAGTLSEDGQAIAGTFSQGAATLPFELKRGSLPVAARPQEPKAPFPYRDDLVTYRNDTAGISIAGTLTLPQGPGPFPAVLLITGSGAQDRNSTIMGHQPFLVWADALTQRGVAVLRVDDRGVGGTDRGSVQPTTLDFAGDVRAGLAFLAARPDIDARRLGLVGHSEGANIAAIVAADDPRVQFIVMLAGSGVRGDEILLRQFEAVAASVDAPRPVVDWQLQIRRRVFDQILAEKDGQPDQAARQAVIDSLPPVPGTTDAGPGREVATALFTSLNPWLRHFLAADPRDVLTRVKVPVLALIGDLDLQVPSRENVPAIRAALEAAGNTDATVRAMPGLNHLFQTAKTGQLAEYEQIEETIAPAVLTMVGDWIVARGKQAR